MTAQRERDRDDPQDLKDLDDLDDGDLMQPTWGLPLRAENFVDGVPASTVDCFDIVERDAGTDARGHVQRTLLGMQGLFELAPREDPLRLYFFKRWTEDLAVNTADIIGIVILTDRELRLETNVPAYTASLRGTIEGALGNWIRHRVRRTVNPFEMDLE